MSRFTDDQAAFAGNWRTILLIDAAIGWAMIIVAFLVRGIIGLVLLGAGGAYLVLNLRRGRRWRAMRREAGLDQ